MIGIIGILRCNRHCPGESQKEMAPHFSPIPNTVSWQSHWTGDAQCKNDKTSSIRVLLSGVPLLRVLYNKPKWRRIGDGLLACGIVDPSICGPKWTIPRIEVWRPNLINQRFAHYLLVVPWSVPESLSISSQQKTRIEQSNPGASGPPLVVSW